MWYVYICANAYVYVERDKENIYRIHFIKYVWNKRGKWKIITEQAETN